MPVKRGDYMIEIDTDELNKFRLPGSKDKKKRKKKAKSKSVKEVISDAYEEKEDEKKFPWQSTLPKHGVQSIYTIK